ncbi:MAG: putative ATPase [Planctomycetota bacterium]|nr:putative ATPase [Planctomycetota bacterium]
MIRPYDAWILGRLLIGLTLFGELDAVSRPFRSLAEHLARLPVEERQTALGGFLCSIGIDPDLMRIALAGLDPEGPPPETMDSRSFATLEDIARIVSNQPWLWRDWIAGGVLNVVASEPGTGKTRFALDLARRLWFALAWPDNQANHLPERTKTLWIQGDRNFAEMLQASQDFGLPGESVALGSSPDDPTGALDLDDPETLAAIGQRIEAAAPALVVIDTVGMVTDRNLCRPEEARAFFAPLIDLAGKTGVAFLGLTHLSKDKEALGRRIVEKARVVIKMTQPDPEGQKDRRRLWVDKTAVVKPPALGITMGGAGNDYDFTPPAEREANRGGRPPEKLDKAIAFLTEKLTGGDRKWCELVTEWEALNEAKGTLFNASRTMLIGGLMIEDTSRKPKVCQLVKNPENSQQADS